MTPDDMIAQDRIYARALSEFDPVIAGAACEEWSRTEQFWPQLQDILALCRVHERNSAAGNRPQLPAPQRGERPRLTDAQTLAMWAENDRLAADMHANPQDYVCGPALRQVFAGFSAKRWHERPDLAERYYGHREDAA